MVRERRREIAGRLIQLYNAGDDSGYEFEQAQHWFYCLSEVLSEDRNSDDFWSWVARAAHRATQ